MYNHSYVTSVMMY